MRVLIVQFVPDLHGRRVPRFEPQLATLMALLRQRGHELALAGLSRFELPPLKAALARALPQLVYADISSVCVDAARRTLEYLHEHEFIPVVVGGTYATVDPPGALSLPGVHAAAIGEPDASLVTYLERVKDPAAGQVVPGVWLRDERGLERPDLPALVEELDSLPLAERDLFGYADFVRETGQIEVAVGRGCPQQCAYCINDWLESIYENRGTWVRRRSVDHVLNEIAALRGRFAGVREARFLDHAFALDGEWLSAFLPAYHERVGLPFRCHVRANAISAELIAQLAGGGCSDVEIEVVSGSDFLRNEIFDMELSNAQIVAAFGKLRGAGIRTHAIVYLGAPYESEASLADTRKLLLELRPDEVDVRVYFPYPGTRAAELARENGWLHPRGEEQYHADRNGIDMPACRSEVVAAFVRRLRGEFSTVVGAPWWRRWTHAPRTALHQILHRK